MTEVCPRCGEKHKQPKTGANWYKYCYQSVKQLNANLPMQKEERK